MAACAYNPPPIPPDARSGDAIALAGRWLGTYRVVDGPPRAGSIEFALVAGEDHAHGVVVMVPGGAPHAYTPWRDVGPAPEGRLEDLTIRFVDVASGEVSGELDPYRDPDCDCQASTCFRGRVRGDVVEGDFVIRTDRGAARGTWEARRVAPRPSTRP